MLNVWKVVMTKSQRRVFWAKKRLSSGSRTGFQWDSQWFVSGSQEQLQCAVVILPFMYSVCLKIM